MSEEYIIRRKLFSFFNKTAYWP